MKTNISLNRPEQAASDALVEVWIEQFNRNNENVDSVDLRKIAQDAINKYDTYLRSRKQPIYKSKNQLALLVSRTRHFFYD